MTSASPATRAISRLDAIQSRLGPRRRAAGYVVVLVGAGSAALAFGLWGAGRLHPVVPGSASPGALTTWGLPICRVAADAAVVATIGMLVTALLLPRTERRFGEAAHRCLRGASWASLAWAVAIAALLPLTWSDLSGLPVTRVTLSQVFEGPRPFPGASSYVFAAVLAAIIAVAARVTRTAVGIVVVLLLSGYNVLPLTTQGHEGLNSITGPVVTAHVLAMAVWVGCLAGLLIHVRRSPDLLAVAVPRFNRLALACFVVVGASGLIAAWVQLGSVSELRTSHFGLVVQYKAEALIALGAIAWWHRRRTTPGVVSRRSPRAFIRLAAVEFVVMAVAVALGVSLSGTPAPAAPVPAERGTPQQPYGASAYHVPSWNGPPMNS